MSANVNVKFKLPASMLRAVKTMEKAAQECAAPEGAAEVPSELTAEQRRAIERAAAEVFKKALR
ncbi:hypothetical protein [Corallococcus sp. EGB]|uniref:hypothetical protein n=1 Tax=Corallococcus sp. EGB TaxID=1521117 RepID=UPI001CBDCF5C|nr:hypothetical protein [Corallococcus sp. EGB]